MFTKLLIFNQSRAKSAKQTKSMCGQTHSSQESQIGVKYPKSGENSSNESNRKNIRGLRSKFGKNPSDKRMNIFNLRTFLDKKILLRACREFAVMSSLTVLMVLGTHAQQIQPIYSFPQGPATPYAALLQGPDGTLYGTTYSGGSGGLGTVIKVTTNGMMTLLYSFSPPTATEGSFITNVDGVQPEAALALGPNGNFYGTTYSGGTNGLGTVFEITTNGALTTLIAFAGTNGAHPEAGLTFGPDGNFYGTTEAGGTNGNGTIFKMTTNGILTALHSFTVLNDDFLTGGTTNTDGANPYAGLVLGTNGAFYGTTAEGGKGGSGTLFDVTTNGAFTNLYTFSAENYNDSGLGAAETNSDGAQPIATLALGSDGNFYGTTRGGGKGGSGTLFKTTPSGALMTLYTFTAGHYVYSAGNHYTNSEGAFPYAGLTQGTNGNFYGAASAGGIDGLGALFEVTPGGTFTPLLTFTNANGANPGGTLALGADGNFYGTTGQGGTSGNGTVFRVATTGAFTNLYSFANYNGANPYAGLTLGPNGNFYGTTYQGGAYGVGTQSGPDGYGTVFEITNGVLMTLVNFAGTNGANPEGALTLGTNGNFYGTTYSGGSNNFGTVFELTTNGVLTTLVNFAQTNGADPAAGLTLGTNGNFYGTTALGGADGDGTVFEVTPGGVLTRLYSFTDGNDGGEPYAGLTLGTNGNFYGVTTYGGADSWGTVFEVTPSGGLTTLHTFADGTDGASPLAPLILGPNGNYYGTTAGDDSSTWGTVFEMTPGGTLTNLYIFTGGHDGGWPEALTLGPDGNFYGTTHGADSSPDGTVFEVTSGGAFATLATFVGINGESSRGSVVLGPDGNFYGTTSFGGAQEIGEVYRLDLPPEILQQPATASESSSAEATLLVTLFGTAPYSFQWLSNNIVIAAAMNSTLMIPDFLVSDVADYSVIVSNAWGSTTSGEALLTVGDEPLIIGINLSTNGSVTLNCQGVPNVSSRVWASTNLALTADWAPVFTNSTTAANGAWQFTDNSRLYLRRYYRLSTP